jgi:LysR family transcriptional regulator, glycine cleavage system transcriptional activator
MSPKAPLAGKSGCSRNTSALRFLCATIIGLEITQAGKRLLPTLQAAFDSIAHTLDGIRTDPSNQVLTVNAAPTLATRWLTPRLRDFQRRYPELHISITNEYGALHGAERNEDCQIRFGIEPQPGCQSTRIMRERHIHRRICTRVRQAAR